MGKKMKLLPLPLHLLFKTPNHSKPSWLWRSCSQPRTLSFRTSSSYNNIFRTINSAYLDNAAASVSVYDSAGDDPVEEVVRGLRRPGGRLFLQLEETSSIMEMAAKEEEEEEISFFKESVVLAMDSKDPYLDFKKSMEEMVEAYGLKDWKGMEELLNWYLKANGERNHDFIIGAFVDLLVGLAFRNSIIKYSSSSSSSSTSNCCCSSSSSSNSSSSFSKTTCLSSSLEIEEIDYCNSSSSTTTPYPSLSSLFEDDEEVFDDFNSKQ